MRRSIRITGTLFVLLTTAGFLGDCEHKPGLPYYELTIRVAPPLSGTVTTEPAGINCQGLCTYAFNGPTRARIIATAAPGHSLIRISGESDCTDGVVDLREISPMACTVEFTDPGVALGGWEQLGAGYSATDVATPLITLDRNDRPVVAHLESDTGALRVRVRRFDGTDWMDLGIANPLGVGNTTHFSMVLDAQDAPVLAWIESVDTQQLLYVARWNGLVWERLCQGLSNCELNFDNFDRASNPSIQVDDGGRIAVAWVEDGVVSLKRLGALGWETHASGRGPSESGPAVDVALTFEASMPVVAWVRESSRNTVHVAAPLVIGATEIWTVVSGELSGEDASRNAASVDLLNLVTDDAPPIVAWSAEGDGRSRAFMRQYDDITVSWRSFDNPNSPLGIPAAYVGPTFAIANNGTPLLAVSYPASGPDRLDVWESDGETPYTSFPFRVSSPSLAMARNVVIRQPFLAWIRNGQLEVWRWTPPL